MVTSFAGALTGKEDDDSVPVVYDSSLMKRLPGASEMFAIADIKQGAGNGIKKRALTLQDQDRCIVDIAQRECRPSYLS